MNAGQTVDDTKDDDGITVRIVSDLNSHGVQQHLIEPVSKQWLGQFTEEVL